MNKCDHGVPHTKIDHNEVYLASTQEAMVSSFWWGYLSANKAQNLAGASALAPLLPLAPKLGGLGGGTNLLCTSDGSSVTKIGLGGKIPYPQVDLQDSALAQSYVRQ